ncbi:stonustoxin subunit beta-like [Polypterus senegalus]|uniref:stonustoxin subunit beta-like n=1 Tax=Polypterus senegalus TaxID=55291 RepID=UPI0019629D12|nr:stonustoxin subunit beta-like [Polypterus senegalus]
MISRWVIMTRTPSDFCPLTLDVNTANRYLHLSEGNKKVTWEWTKTEYPDHPDRFDKWSQVLCTEALTGTRCYWEVECSGDFMVIGVAYKGLGRKGWDCECGFGQNDKSWCLWWSLFWYFVRHNNQWTVIGAPHSPRIGVYLDWPAGSLSFYSILHTEKYNPSTCHLQKFSEDSSIIGCIKYGDESKHRRLLKDFSFWCWENHLLIEYHQDKRVGGGLLAGQRAFETTRCSEGGRACGAEHKYL